MFLITPMTQYQISLMYLHRFKMLEIGRYSDKGPDPNN